MAEEVEIERPVCCGANGRDLRPHPVSIKHRARNRAEPTRPRDRHRKRAPLRTSHRCLHYPVARPPRPPQALRAPDPIESMISRSVAHGQRADSLQLSYLAHSVNHPVQQPE